MQRLVAAFLVCTLPLLGCTIRYSQSLTGTIPKESGTRVRTSDAGFELFQIALSDPTHAHEQVTSLMGACTSLTEVEVDYRSLSFFIISFPRVTIQGNCIK
jgi:hypothetical protein